ncbi:MAG: ecotin [Chryseobacterium sp.]|uniref:ecotin n=1 Tax=Chryseobacterium sp. TaxID=1871047 RepID=UPI0025C1C9DA|nr:ecotin [Chryseobacterium sp.]MCJ7932651.1 ecotin [Chryseobacterium sp.]
MRNQKLTDLSKKVTEGKVKSLSTEEVNTISGGKGSIDLEVSTCNGDNGCWGFSAPACGAKNSCWSY